MSSTLSIYHSPWHWLERDFQYMRRLAPAWVRIHQPSARAIHLDQQAAPNANILLRSWDIDDHNGDRKRELYANPVGAAQRHLDLWEDLLGRLVAELERNGWPYDASKWRLGMINEPDPAHLPLVATYTREAMRIAGERGRRLGVGCFSVGTPGKPGEANSIELFASLAQAIRDGGHILVLHEYWQPEGPSFVWTDGEGRIRRDAGNLAWRHRSIPFDVPILIGESGANGYIYGRHSQRDDAGWRKYMPPEQYAAQVREYIAGCDTRVQGVCLYMLDYHDAQWESFDTGPAAEQLLTVKDTRPGVPFGAPPKPQPPSGPHVAVPAGANVRSGPAVDAPKVGALPQYTEVRLDGRNPAGDWVRVAATAAQPVAGWVSAALIANVPAGLPAVGDGTTIFFPIVGGPASPTPRLRWPVPESTPISQRFGERPEYYKQYSVDGVPLRGHNGLDFAVVVGTPVWATDAGTVVEIGDEGGAGYGRYVKLAHAWGESIYAHGKLVLVSLGDVVTAGEVIMWSGNTGNSSGPHLHFAIRVKPYRRNDGWGGYSDPLPYLTTSVPAHDVVGALKAAAQEFGVRESLLLSLAWAESSFRPDAKSPAGAMGLCQVMPSTWAEWGPRVGAHDPYSAIDNARVGAAYYRWIRRQLSTDTEALAAYVWGIGNVLADREPPVDVQTYAAKIVHGADLLDAVGG